MICAADDTRRVRAALLARGRARRAARTAAEIAARRVRPAALRRRPRRHRDPAGGRPQRARGLVHEGLLRRPGDGRAAATTAASRTATCAGCGCPRRSSPATPLRLGEREVGRARQRRRLAARSGRSRSRSCAARRRPGDTLDASARRRHRGGRRAAVRLSALPRRATRLGRYGSKCLAGSANCTTRCPIADRLHVRSPPTARDRRAALPCAGGDRRSAAAAATRRPDRRGRRGATRKSDGAKVADAGRLRGRGRAERARHDADGVADSAPARCR